jgi:hypothetical protein
VKDNQMVQKPNWLKAEDWTVLLQRHGGVPHCAITGETDDLSVDHIIPVYHGGTDDASNLQFLTKSLNSRKGIQPDAYWRRPFYFDQVPVLSQCRAAQSGLYRELLAQGDWFSEPSSNISRLLYMFPMVVAAGKTLSTLIASCAYNQAIRAKWGAARRADRILVLTKERAIRDQFVRDLSHDPMRYGIFPSPPRVAAVEKGFQFDNEAWLSSHDVIVSCLQQLWDGTKQNLPELLHRFPIIAFDEPHFAADRVLSLVEMAKTSICFGFTGTPIDAAGDLLPRMIKVFSFGYQDADEKDRSVKYLNDTDWEQEHLQVAELDAATLLDRGEMKSSIDTSANGYGKNLEPAKSVAWEVILRMERSDQLVLANVQAAPHRLYYDPPPEVSIRYPLHAMLSCDNVRFANHLCKTINEECLDRHRDRFPRASGWNAEVVHCEGEEPDNSKRPDKPLLPGHAWLRASQQGNQIDQKCSRILLVVGMGREGVNNPLCGLFGVTSDHLSLIEAVQRVIGRQLRSTVIEHDGIWSVPPAELDTVGIITHEAFVASLRDVLRDAIDFVVNMDVRLEGMATVADLREGTELPERKGADLTNYLPFVDRLQIAGAIGARPNTPDIDLVVQFGEGHQGREKTIREWIDLVRTEPLRAAQRLKVHSNFQLQPIVQVLWEGLTRDPSDRQLQAFLRAKHPEVAELPIDDHTRPFAKLMFAKDANEVNAATPSLFNPDGSRRHIDDIRKALGRTVEHELGHHYVRSSENDRERWRLIGRATKLILGVPDDQKAGIDSRWDIPACHLILERSDVQRDLRSWVIARLIEGGCCPTLNILHQDAGLAAA